MMLLPIVLPKGYKVKIEKGQKVSAGDVLAKKPSSFRDEVIHIAKDFNISPKDISKFLKKSPGTFIKKGDTIAIKKRFGIRSRDLVSDFNGTLVRVDKEKGQILVRLEGDDDKKQSEDIIISPVDGIVDFCDNDKIVLQTEKFAIVADYTHGVSGKGTFFTINKEEIEDGDVKKEIIEKIVVGKSFDKAAIFKAFAIGGFGVILQNIRQEDLEEILERNISKPLFVLSEENYNKLMQYQGKEIYLDVENKAIFIS